MAIIHRLQAAAELLGRYGRAWRHAWQHRDELTPPPHTRDEAEFLPAALALQAEPTSPTGRWVARIIVAGVFGVLAWAFLGHSEIIVNAGGRIVPRGQSKTVAALETARVRALYVEEGQTVHAGDLLVELDTRLSDGEQLAAEQARAQAELQVARASALLKALDTGRAPVLPNLSGADPTRLSTAQRHLQDQWSDLQARLARLDAEIRRSSAELPLATQRAQDYAELARSRDVPQHAWIEKEQARLELQGQLAGARAQRAALVTELRTTTQNSRLEAQRQFDTAQAEARRAQSHGELLRVTAPVDGTVHQLAAHTVGGIVPAAQPLMQIVPAQADVELEVMVENRDIGFVHEGQPAQVKLDAYDYTRFGSVPATVRQVARDAVQDEHRGPLYPVRLTLERRSLTVHGREAPIGPGLSGSAEIVTGERRLIDYVLSPLLRHGRESLHER